MVIHIRKTECESTSSGKNEKKKEKQNMDSLKKHLQKC